MQQPPPGPPPEANHCKIGRISCWEFSLIFAYIGLVLASGAAGYLTLKRRAHDKGVVEGQGMCYAHLKYMLGLQLDGLPAACCSYGHAH